LIPRAQAGLLEIEPSRIRPNPQQPRLRLDEVALSELAASVREHGLLQPVVVTEAEDGDGYVLIAGERRWRAAQLAGLVTIPAVVKEAAPRQRLELALVENVQREDLSPLEMAAAFRALVEEHGLTQGQVAQRVGKSRVSVANTLRLYQLPRAAREALAAGKISEGHARALLVAPNEAVLLSALEQLLERDMTVREAEELIRRVSATQAAGAEQTVDQPARPAASRYVSADGIEAAYLEDRLRAALGTRVQLLRGRRGGRLVIHFYSDEELEGIYQAICGG
jgi:ParB family chromosome partitioning protein